MGAVSVAAHARRAKVATSQTAQGINHVTNRMCSERNKPDAAQPGVCPGGERKLQVAVVVALLRVQAGGKPSCGQRSSAMERPVSRALYVEEKSSRRQLRFSTRATVRAVSRHASRR